MIEKNLNRYFNELRTILKERQECFEYYNNTIKLVNLQKKANMRLFYQKPLIYLIRFLFYLPINLVRIIRNVNNHFYITKLQNEIEVIKLEISNNMNIKNLKIIFFI